MSVTLYLISNSTSKYLLEAGAFGFEPTFCPTALETLKGVEQERTTSHDC